MFIHALPITRKSVPAIIKNAVELIKDIRTIVDTHKNDSPDLCVTGRPLLYWSGNTRLSLVNTLHTHFSLVRTDGPAPGSAVPAHCAGVESQ